MPVATPASKELQQHTHRAKEGCMPKRHHPTIPKNKVQTGRRQCENKHASNKGNIKIKIQRRCDKRKYNQTHKA
jgi:hypothetical protein